MLLAWGLIFSVTLVSVTMLMIVGAYTAIIPEAEEYYQVNRTLVLMFSNVFNIFYVVISPLLFDSFNRHYLRYVTISTIASGVGAVGRYLAGTNYVIALAMTSVIAIAHIPVITAPYGLLKLFPDHQKGYAASIPLFLPVLGINFCIIYGMSYIASGQGGPVLSTFQIHQRIHNLNGIIAIVGLISSALTLILLYKLKDRILAICDLGDSNEESFISKVIRYTKDHKLTIITLVCWGSIVGVNWTYGSLFRVIFQGQGLTEKEIALLGLAANLSTAFFSNLGTFIKNRFNIFNPRVIGILNLCGFVAAILLQGSKTLPQLQNLYLMIGLIIVLRAGFSSFVSLAFIEMQLSGISSVIVSGMFFWVANMVNFGSTQIMDLMDTEIGMCLISLFVAVCIHIVSESYIKSSVSDA